MQATINDTVTISRDEYEEFIRLKKNQAYLNMLDRGFSALKNGEPGIRKSMAELRAMENE